MCKLKYSIIYAIIRPEISERISVGIIMFDENSVDIRYSDRKLKALEYLCSKAEYDFISRTVRTMKKREVVRNEQDVHYLSRYSNNLLKISELQMIDIEASERSKNWLYKSYIHSSE